MASNINYYETMAQFDAEYWGEGYVEPWVSYVEATETVKYNKTEYEKLLETPLTFEILSDGNIVWKAYNTGVTRTIEYKKNDGEWTEITSTTGGTSINVVSGDTIQFRGDNSTYAGSYQGWGYPSSLFSGTTAGFNLKGNIMSLIDSTGFTNRNILESVATFYGIFQYCAGLNSAQNLILPATTLANYCYSNMFNGCTSLTTAPELPATTLAGSCYNSMFKGCTSLTTAPELPATTLAGACYASMFSDCISLTTTPELPAETLTEQCYQNMFYGCTSLTQAPELPATTLTRYCYQSMFQGCTGLTTAPELPATTLASSCYFYMFYNCTNLNYIKCLATDISANSSHSSWVFGVSSSGTFIKSPDITESTWGRGANGIPGNWTVQDAS